MNYKWLLVLVCVFFMACDGTQTKTKVTRKGTVGGADKQPGRRSANPAPTRPPAPAVGAMAPDIVGVDLDGAEFKLSDYRGKVVMLDFWGDW